MAAAGKRGVNEPEPRPIVVKKIIVEGHGGHHGGAWKVAYADFVTAMMAFFLLMWLLGATTEKQRKGLADYFTPTLVEIKTGSAGADGLFGGDSMTGKENYPTTGGQGNLAITIPRDASGTADIGGKDMKTRDRTTFARVTEQVKANLAASKALAKLGANMRITETREGLRIDLIDQADFSMFASGSDRMLPSARALLGEVARVISSVPNGVIVRGHTDGMPFARGGMNNWMLSSARAEATRRTLGEFGVGANRFARIEGVADREPYVPANLADPRNRRISIILAWTEMASAAQNDAIDSNLIQKSTVQLRDDPQGRARQQVLIGDMAGTGLPRGATPINMMPAPDDKTPKPTPTGR